MRFSIRPAFSSTCRWRVIAGALMRKGFAISPTVRSPLGKQALDDGAPRRVGERGEDVIEVEGSGPQALRGSLINRFVN